MAVSRRTIAGTLLTALAAGSVFRVLNAPLPWLIGPLLATAACGMRGLPVAASPTLLHVGQWCIGCSLGLYFTPKVLQTLVTLAPAVIVAVVWALLLGHLFYRLLWRLNGGPSGMDRATAYFSAAIGGASEMATLAHRHGARVDLVAAAHALRVLVVVVLIPFGFKAAGLHGLDSLAPAATGVRVASLAPLIAITAAAGLCASRARLPNPWLLGALFSTLLLSASGLSLSALPKWITGSGQLFIGVALGTRFTPGFVHTAPRWLASVAIGTLGMILISTGFAWALAGMTHLHPATVLLGTSPGGIAEMCLTAQALQLGVPVVTAFHVVRYIAVLLLTEPLYRRLAPTKSSWD